MITHKADASAPTNPPLRQTALPGARHALILLLAINLFNYIDRQVLSSVVRPIEGEFFPDVALPGTEPDSASRDNVEAKLGSLQTAFMVSYMLIAPIFGWLADRMSRWLLIGIGVILWSLASGGSGWAPSFTLLLLTRCLVGVGEAAYGPAAPTIISDLYPVTMRGKVLAWFYAAIPVGSALGYVLGGLALKFTGQWRSAFYLVLPPGLLLGLCALLMREPARGQADAVSGLDRHRLRLADLLVLLRTPSYVLDTLGMTAMAFALGGLAFWMPRYIFKDRHVPNEDNINLIFGAIVVVSGLVATLLGGIAGDKLRPRYPGSYFLVAGFSMLCGFPMVLLVLWTPFPWAWIFVFLSCFCLFFNTGPTNTILANVTHPSVRSSAFAINILILHSLGDAVSPTIIGFIAHYSNMDAGFFFVSFLILWGGILWLWGSRYLARDTALAPTRLAFPGEP